MHELELVPAHRYATIHILRHCSMPISQAQTILRFVVVVDNGGIIGLHNVHEHHP